MPRKKQAKKPVNKAMLEGKVVRLVWASAEELPTLYANHLFVTHGGESEFHIVFGYLAPPLIMPGSPDEIPDAFIIKPIAKIVVTPQRMKKFIEAMNTNLKRFEEREKEG